MSASPSPLPAFEEIAETMSYLPDLDAKYQFLIDLSKRLPLIEEEEETDDYRVFGCQSSVWIVPFHKDGESEVLSFRGKSDSVLVSGIIATVLSLFAEKTPAEILDLDAPAELKRLDLESHLSPSRRNGLVGMIERIREYAAEERVKADG
ncbi:MAG: SufE family protein [Verrucomicrobiales bacterium]|nr:SufE family protein [Verrucomicrobiales bacterium]